ncbi:MAG: GTP-binding protein [Lachnospiraceae bacterium]|nr:GTP-binding protein [Lachnospiraceae bacterium]
MTKIDIVSGFLGAGKTTLIKKLLKEALSGEQVVLIENEFGQIGIDGGFLKEAGIEIKEMNSGCICCSLVGDFGTSLKEVLEQYHPDRILIEPSGVGKLSDVMKAVEDVAAHTEVKLNSAVAVVDASKCKTYLKNFGEFFANQIEHAGTIILSRTGQMSEDKIEQSLSLIREHNEGAAVITTPWEQLDGTKILETIEGCEDFQQKLLQEVLAARDHEEHEHHHHDHDHEEHEHHHDHEHEEHEHHHDHGPDCTCGCHDHDHDHDHHHHHADDVFTSWGKETPHKYSKQELDDLLAKLADQDTYGYVLRAKGIVDSEGESFLYFDYVPGESEIREGAAEYTGKICVIGSELKEDKLAELFA